MTRLEYQRKYRAENRDKLNAQQRAWCAANREKVNARARIYHDANREEINAKARTFGATPERREYLRKYKEKNRERLLALAVECTREYRKKNKDKVIENARRWRDANRERLRAQQRELYYKNPERIRAKTRRRVLKQYGLTPESWNILFEQQGKCCAICGSLEPKSKLGWATDHDHNTGKLRGILCTYCNQGLGRFEDDINILARAIEYLSR